MLINYFLINRTNNLTDYFEKTEEYGFMSDPEYCCEDMQLTSLIRFNDKTGRMMINVPTDWYGEHKEVKYCPFCGTHIEYNLTYIRNEVAKRVSRTVDEIVYEIA